MNSFHDNQANRGNNFDTDSDEETNHAAILGRLHTANSASGSNESGSHLINHWNILYDNILKLRFETLLFEGVGGMENLN